MIVTSWSPGGWNFCSVWYTVFESMQWRGWRVISGHRDVTVSTWHSSQSLLVQLLVKEIFLFGCCVPVCRDLFCETAISPQSHFLSAFLFWPCDFPTYQLCPKETQRNLYKFSEPDRKPKVIYTDNSCEFGKVWSFLELLYVDTTQIRNKWDCRKCSANSEGRHLCCIVAIRSDNWWADSMECYTYLRNVTDLLSDEKTLYERRFGQPFKGPIIPVGSLVEYHPFYCEGPIKNPSIWKESLTWIVPRIRSVRRGTLEGWHIGCRHWGVGNDARIRNLLWKDSMQRK